MRVSVTPEARERLSAPLRDCDSLTDDDDARWRLRLHDGALALCERGDRGHPLYVDFRAGALGFRLERVRHEALVRACGLTRAGEPLEIVDATAGLGRDAALLAMAGASVTLIESQPLLHSLLADGLARADASLSVLVTLLHADSLDWLRQHPGGADVVYMDPMFPERRKRAAVKKAQRWLQSLAPVWSAAREAAMLAAAQAAARKRVVVKRPVKALFLAGEKPHHQISGKTVRFDVYE